MSAETTLHDAFRVTLMALARPGTVHPVPGAGDAVRAARLVLDAVWEPDAPPVIITGQPEPGELLALPVGTEEEPELGATAVLIVDADAPATRVRLSGPGIDGHLVIRVPLRADALVERARACAGWPAGIDLVLVGPGPSVLGLPRTTRVEEVG